MLGPSAHINAIGRFVLSYNALESVLYTFLTFYLPAPRPSQAAIFRALHNRARVDLIKSLASQQEKDSHGLNLVLNLLRAFDITAENRNILVHACPGGVDGDGNIILRKLSGDSPADVVEYRLSLDTLNRHADSVLALYIKAASLRVLLFHFAHEKPDPELGPLSSYETQPLPDKLSLLGRRPSPESGPYPPPPFVG